MAWAKAARMPSAMVQKNIIREPLSVVEISVLGVRDRSVIDALLALRVTLTVSAGKMSTVSDTR